MQTTEKDLRDYFAAAALTGLPASWADVRKKDAAAFAEMAYAFADAMLAERAKTSAEKETGSGNVTDHDAVTAARASGTPRTDKTASAPEGTGKSQPIANCDTRNGTVDCRETVHHEPVAWAVMDGGKVAQVADHPVHLSGSIHRIVPLYAAPQDRVVRLPHSQTRVNRYAPGGVDYIEGWAMGVADAKRAMDAAGVKWEVKGE